MWSGGVSVENAQDKRMPHPPSHVDLALESFDGLVSVRRVGPFALSNGFQRPSKIRVPVHNKISNPLAPVTEALDYFPGRSSFLAADERRPWFVVRKFHTVSVDLETANEQG